MWAFDKDGGFGRFVFASLALVERSLGACVLRFGHSDHCDVLVWREELIKDGGVERIV